MANLPTDGATCRSVLAAAFPAAAYDAQAGEACLAALRAEASRPEFCQAMRTVDACRNVFSKGAASRLPGERCQSHGDCAPAAGEGKAICALGSAPGAPEQAPVHICQVQLRGKAGDYPCVATVDGTSSAYPAINVASPPRAYLCHVDDGLRCDDKSLECVKLKLAGEACERPAPAGSTSPPSLTEDCAKGTYCDPNQRLCVARKAIATACSTFTGGAECIDDAYCSEAARACTARVADLGACTKDLECRSGSCVQGQCESDLVLVCGRG